MARMVSEFKDFKVNNYYCPQVSAAASASHRSAGTGAFPYYTPNKTLTVDWLGVMEQGVATSTSLTARMALYSSNSSGYPDALLADTGDFTVTGTGNTMVGVTLGSTVNLSPNTLYWLCSKKENTPSNTAASAAGIATAQKVGITWYQASDTDPQNTFTMIAHGFAVGAYPDPFTAGKTPTNSVVSAIIPFFRISAVS